MVQQAGLKASFTTFSSLEMIFAVVSSASVVSINCGKAEGAKAERRGAEWKGGKEEFNISQHHTAHRWEYQQLCSYRRHP